jgi:hypothetical protein
LHLFTSLQPRETTAVANPAQSVNLTAKSSSHSIHLSLKNPQLDYPLGLLDAYRASRTNPVYAVLTFDIHNEGKNLVRINSVSFVPKAAIWQRDRIQTSRILSNEKDLHLEIKAQLMPSTKYPFDELSRSPIWIVVVDYEVASEGSTTWTKNTATFEFDISGTAHNLVGSECRCSEEAPLLVFNYGLTRIGKSCMCGTVFVNALSDSFHSVRFYSRNNTDGTQNLGYVHLANYAKCHVNTIILDPFGDVVDSGTNDEAKRDWDSKIEYLVADMLINGSHFNDSHMASVNMTNSENKKRIGGVFNLVISAQSLVEITEGPHPDILRIASILDTVRSFKRRYNSPLAIIFSLTNWEDDPNFIFSINSIQNHRYIQLLYEKYGDLLQFDFTLEDAHNHILLSPDTSIEFETFNKTGTAEKDWSKRNHVLHNIHILNNAGYSAQGRLQSLSSNGYSSMINLVADLVTEYNWFVWAFIFWLIFLLRPNTAQTSSSLPNSPNKLRQAIPW